MRQFLKKLTVIGFVMVFICTALVAPAREAQAASVKKPSFEKSKMVVFYGGPNRYSNSLNFKNVSKKAVISEVKFSNSSVLMQSGMISENKGISCLPMKPGTCTVSCSVKQNGKTYKLKCKITVKKANPFKYVKIDKKNIYKNGAGNLYNHYTTKASVTVSFKLNKGWKVAKLYTNDHNSNGTMSKDKAFKNGGKIKIRKSYSSLKIDVKNSKGEVYRYLILLHRTSGKNSSASNQKALSQFTVTELGIVE